MTTGWEGSLDPGETVLWQGRPDGAVAFRPRHIVPTIFGIFFSGFGLLSMLMASAAGGGFEMFGPILFSAGLAIAFGALFGDAFLRRRTWYTLTDRRAFIATDLPIKGRSLQSWPITADTSFKFSGEGLTTVHFASRRVLTKYGYRDRPVGFERIAEAEKVLALMWQVQRGAVAPPLPDRTPEPTLM